MNKNTTKKFICNIIIEYFLTKLNRHPELQYININNIVLNV